ncbi:hypothetical protein Efla_000310 [Eimeria flavescens]
MSKFEDRLNPSLQKELDLFTASDNRRSHLPTGPWASEYTMAYSKGNWGQNIKPAPSAPSTILAFDQSGPSDWTSSYRHDYRNRHAEKEAFLRECAEAEKRRAEEASERLRRAEEEQKPQWPFTQEGSIRENCDEHEHRQPRDEHEHRQPGEEDADDNHQREGEAWQQEDRRSSSTGSPYSRQRCELNAEKNEENSESGSRLPHGHTHYHHPHHTNPQQPLSHELHEQKADDLHERMQALRLANPHEYPAAGQRRETVRFGECFRHHPSRRF